jgi:hypothetical protein
MRYRFLSPLKRLPRPARWADRGGLGMTDCICHSELLLVFQFPVGNLYTSRAKPRLRREFRRGKANRSYRAQLWSKRLFGRVRSARMSLFTRRCESLGEGVLAIGNDYLHIHHFTEK